MKTLPGNFYSIPSLATMTMKGRDLQELLLATDGNIFACGHLWNIKNKPLGAGVYKVYLEKQKYERH